MELEAADAVIGDQPAGAATAASPVSGSTEPNGMSTSACAAAPVGHLRAGQPGVTVAVVASTVNTTAAKRRSR